MARQTGYSRRRNAITVHIMAAVLVLGAGWTGIATAGKFSDFFKNFDPEELQSETSQKVLDTANRIDSIFGNDRIDEEAQTTRVRAYTDFDIDEEDGVDIRLRLRAHLVLPNTEDRLRLEFNGNEDDYETDDDDRNRVDGNADREHLLGFNFATTQGAKSQLDLGLGFRYHDSSFAVYEKARHRYYFSGKKWLPRLTNEVRHYGDTGFEYRGSLDFDRAFSERWFFRPRTELRWYEDDDTDDEDLHCNNGYCLNQLFSLYQTLNNPVHAIAYDLNTYFISKPDMHLDELNLGVRYRRQVKWEWLHYEIQPSVRFRDETDYDAEYAIIFRLEGIFGYRPRASTQFIESKENDYDGQKQSQ